MGTSPWLPSPQTERWKQVCLCGNAAVMLLDTQQAAVTLLGRLPQRPEFRHHQNGVASYGVNKEDASNASGIQSRRKKKEKTINMCETRAINRIITIEM